MVTYEVALMHKQTMEGKKIVVQANSPQEAFNKATQVQASPRRWATVLAKPMGMESSKTKFQHKGIRYNV